MRFPKRDKLRKKPLGRKARLVGSHKFKSSGNLVIYSISFGDDDILYVLKAPEVWRFQYSKAKLGLVKHYQYEKKNSIAHVTERFLFEVERPMAWSTGARESHRSPDI